jgi:carbon storage regulator CsrA
VLVISRKLGERIVIGGSITLTVLDIRGDKVRLGVTCPMEVPVHRQEVFEVIHGFRPEPVRPRGAQEQAFVQAIIESPDDEGIRLIFADWLDDHDDPFGEFIRIQCQLARLAEEDAGRQELIEREQALLARHAKAWREHLPPILRSEPFERGFVETARLTVAEFLDHAATIFAATPLRRLVIRAPSVFDVPGSSLAALVASPYLARLSGLDLVGLALGDDEVSHLAASPHLAGLSTLDLAHNQIGEAGARALAASPHLADLLYLDLTHNPLGDGAVALQVRFGERVRV